MFWGKNYKKPNLFQTRPVSTEKIANTSPITLAPIGKRLLVVAIFSPGREGVHFSAEAVTSTRACLLAGTTRGDDRQTLNSRTLPVACAVGLFIILVIKCP